MANSTKPGLVAVVTAALTDLFSVRQSGDTRDKKLTSSQLKGLFLATGGTDKAALRANGTGGATLQGSDLVIGDVSAGALPLSSASGSIFQVPTPVELGGATSSNIRFTNPGFGLLQVQKGDASGYAIVDGERFRSFLSGSPCATLSAAAPGLELAAASAILFASSSDATQAKDGGILRSSAAVLRVSNGSSGIGALETAREIEASTAGSSSPNLLLSTESRKALSNEGAGAEAYNTLPSAAAGYEFVFVCQAAAGIRIVANTGDTIRLGGSVSASAGFVRSIVVGSAVILTAINATEWVAISIVGTWTVDV